LMLNLKELNTQGVSAIQIAKQMEIGRSTVYKILLG
jgi:transposase